MPDGFNKTQSEMTMHELKSVVPVQKVFEQFRDLLVKHIDRFIIEFNNKDVDAMFDKSKTAEEALDEFLNKKNPIHEAAYKDL